MKISSAILKLFSFFILFTACEKDGTNNPAKSWQTINPMPTAKHHFGFTECNGLLYAIGGYNASGLNKTEVYDPSTGNWLAKAPMPTARGYLVVATLSNKIYAIGGITGADLNNITYTNVTEVYDPATDAWTTKAAFPATWAVNGVLGNQFIAGAAINGKIFVAVGNAGGNVSFEYDPAADTWASSTQIVPTFNNEPYYFTAGNNSMYVTTSTAFLQYVGTENEWRVLQSFITPREAACLAVSGDVVYSAGGVIGTYDGTDYIINNMGNVEAYSATSSTWTESTPLNKKRHSAAALVFDNKLYVAGGSEKQPNFLDVPIADVEVLALD